VTAKKFPGQLPTDCGPLPRLLYSVDEVAEMFGKAPMTIRAACWEHGLPYRLETTWGPGGRRFRRMVFSMREISALLDHYAPPVNQVLDAAAASPRPRRASRKEKPADASR
jgi:hypothetical protein